MAQTDQFRPLVDRFLDTKGAPLCIDGKKIIQMDRMPIPKRALVRVKFVGDRIYEENAVVIAVQRGEKIYLSDGTFGHAVAIWDEPCLPREAKHIVEARSGCLDVYNKYRMKHSEDFITEDSFTGNAGMHVTVISDRCRQYECSNGAGPFVLDDLVFELCWEPLKHCPDPVDNSIPYQDIQQPYR